MRNNSLLTTNHLSKWNKDPIVLAVREDETLETLKLTLFPPYHPISALFGNENKDSSVNLNPHYLHVVSELDKGNYTSKEREHYLSWIFKLTLLQLEGASQDLKDPIENLCEQILRVHEYEVVKRTGEDSNNPSYLLVHHVTQQPFAILKLPKIEFDCSFEAHVPEIGQLIAPVWQHDLISYEQDRLFGFDSIPDLVAVEVEKNGVKERGVIQRYIPNSKAANSFCWDYEQGAELLKSMPAWQVHQLAIESIFLGFAAGHGANYLLQTHPDTNCPEKIVRGYLNDEKEAFIPFNRVLPNMQTTRGIELQQQISELEKEASPARQAEIDELKKRLSEHHRSIILLHIWILGLPQCGEAMKPALLSLLCHPALLQQLKSYHREITNYYALSDEAKQAQLERIQGMQQLAKKALDSSSSLTLRELYFHLFGGEHLYEIGKEKNYPHLILFANLISDPYRYALKDPAYPERIEPSTRLEKPIEDKEEDIRYMQNLRKLEGLNPL